MTRPRRPGAAEFSCSATVVRFRFYAPQFMTARPVVVTVLIRMPAMQLAPLGEVCSPFGDDPFTTWRVAGIGTEGGVLTLDVR